MADIHHLSQLLAPGQPPILLVQILKFIGYITQLKDNILLVNGTGNPRVTPGYLHL